MASFTGESMTVTWNDFVEAGEVTKDNFTVTKAPVTLTPKEGEVVLEMLYLSVDPYMRGRMRDQPGYMMPPFVPGEPFTGGCMAKVVESNSSKYEKDDVLVGFMSWKKFFVAR
jgi:NADPH-dependent curcumin reductase CurA